MVPSMLPYVTDFERGKNWILNLDLGLGFLRKLYFFQRISNFWFFPGFINCHVRDAAALCSYFAWLEKEIPTGTVTEISGADKLASLRGEMENFVGLSFDTISSVGANGAIIHYKPSAGKYKKFHRSTCEKILTNC